MVSRDGQVRWGILGTAKIAHSAFLPGLRAAGGIAAAVAGRDQARTQEYASANRIERAITGYQALLEDPGIDAVYIPLPNGLHAEWTIRALQAGKPVLCEKPLCGTLADTERVLAAAREEGTFLWEAFVFPFHEQLAEIRKLVADGLIGDLVEIKSNFHFPLNDPQNIRLSRELEGGALLDVGCYPVRLAQEFFGPAFTGAWARAIMGGANADAGRANVGAADVGGAEVGGAEVGGVDVDTWGVLDYPGGRRLLLSCGMRRAGDTYSALEGTAGRIYVTNAFHPRAEDFYQVVTPGSPPRTYEAPAPEPSFTPALRHIDAVILGEAAPRLLATQTSLATARALHALAMSFAADYSDDLGLGRTP